MVRLKPWQRRRALVVIMKMSVLKLRSAICKHYRGTYSTVPCILECMYITMQTDSCNNMMLPSEVAAMLFWREGMFVAAMIN